MVIDRETIIKLASEEGLTPVMLLWDKELERFTKRVAEHSASVEREAIIAILKGIDETEIESPDGWWETSGGAAFGASILAAIRARGNT